MPFKITGRSMQSLPQPEPGGSLAPLWDLLNVKEAQRPLVTGALLNFFHPQYAEMRRETWVAHASR